MYRYTLKSAQATMERLALTLGKHLATSYSDVGGWELDYNPTYGGCVIQEIVNEHGGVTCPLGDMRRKLGDFCDTIHFAFRVLEISKS